MPGFFDWESSKSSPDSIRGLTFPACLLENRDVRVFRIWDSSRWFWLVEDWQAEAWAGRKECNPRSAK